MLKHKPSEIPLATLDMLTLARDEKWLRREHADALQKATKLYQAIQQALAVTVSGNFNPEATPISVKNLLTRITNAKDFAALEKAYRQACAQVADIFLKTIC